MKDKLKETIERCHHDSRRKIWKKNSKPVKWNGQIFESGVALVRHLKLPNINIVSVYIKAKRKLKGFVPELVKEGDSER